jgi:hypothetical protein
MEVTYYKWLNPDRTTTYQGVKWPKRVGVWTPDKTPVLCQSGWHLATHQGIGEHARVGAVLWTAEGRGESAGQKDDKIAFTSARLVSEVGTLTHETAVLWAAECAKRVLTIYEDKYRDDKRPREAIAAAVKWAKNPTEKNRDAAYHAASSASSASSAYHAASYAAYAAYAAANAAYAAYAAANAAYAVDANAYASANAAYAVYAHAEARTVERLWQSNRLVALISGTTGATGKATK